MTIPSLNFQKPPFRFFTYIYQQVQNATFRFRPDFWFGISHQLLQQLTDHRLVNLHIRACSKIKHRRPLLSIQLKELFTEHIVSFISS